MKQYIVVFWRRSEYCDACKHPNGIEDCTFACTVLADTKAEAAKKANEPYRTVDEKLRPIIYEIVCEYD